MRNKSSIFILIIAFLMLFFYFIKNYNLPKKFRFDCINKIKERIIRGNSMSGVIEADQTVKIFFGYYNCNKVKAGDVVAYNFTGNSEPIIKIVKAIGGDKFQLRQSPDKSGWNVAINDKVAKNSVGEPYILNESGHRMLFLYEKDYKGIIPENSYLLLGNLSNGTLDSSRFGLVSKNDILGKVEY
ncbi:signal peptidase I [Candidatus Falkowbacteria bacterium]|nr:signal peptidase I [Candidatus Falkowbacteria bacterium]